MTGVRCALWVLVAVLLAARSDAAPAGGDGAVFPFVKGTLWTYAGTVKWTDDRNRHRSGDVRWNSEVIDAFDDGDVAGALLQGGVWDLAWWSPDTRAGTYAVLRVGTRHYLVRSGAEGTFAEVKVFGRNGLPAGLDQLVWFDTPLKVGQLYRPSDAAPRNDTMDGWLIESAAPPYVLSYATLPDDERITLVPGIGITAFAYVHHGTIAEADVHLIAYRAGGVK